MKVPEDVRTKTPTQNIMLVGDNEGACTWLKRHYRIATFRIS
jgi:hypothetical protein